MVTRWVVEGVDRRGGHKFLTEGNEENKASEVAMLQRNLFSVVAFWLICARQNHSRNTFLQNRFMKVNQQSDRNVQQLHVAKQLRFV